MALRPEGSRRFRFIAGLFLVAQGRRTRQLQDRTEALPCTAVANLLLASNPGLGFSSHLRAPLGAQSLNTRFGIHTSPHLTESRPEHVGRAGRMGSDAMHRAQAIQRAPPAYMQEVPFWQNVFRFMTFFVTVMTGVIFSIVRPLFEIFSRGPLEALVGITFVSLFFGFIASTLSAMNGDANSAFGALVDAKAQVAQISIAEGVPQVQVSGAQVAENVGAVVKRGQALPPSAMKQMMDDIYGDPSQYQ